MYSGYLQRWYLYFLIHLALAHTSFIKCPEAALKWSYRRHLILQEILRSGADIVCLEEVDHYEDFFKPELSRHGFDGCFFPKCDSPCLSFPDNNGPDGCALFYRSAKFELLEKKEIVLQNTEGKDSHQVALLGKLKVKQREGGVVLSSIVVAMAHFKAKTEGKQLRAAQGRHLVQEATALAGVGAEQLPVVVVGDFNATADEEVYQFFTNPDAHPDLKLRSSYEVASGKEPVFTSWKFRAKGEAKYTIDYIWYAPERLQVEGVWGIPDEGDIGENALPCRSYPSDHVALCCEFNFKL